MLTDAFFFRTLEPLEMRLNMENNNVIKLGPLLGIEGDLNYTITFLSETDIDEKDLNLEVYDLDHIFTAPCTIKTELQKHFAYRFEFEIVTREKTGEVAYEICKASSKLRNQFGINKWKFVVPSKSTMPKVGFASCNGIEKYPTALKPNDFVMWERLMAHHHKDLLNYSFHCLLLGGDQLYTDSIWEKIPYFKKHNLLSDNSIIEHHIIEDEDLRPLEQEIAQFYEQLYIDSWNNKYMSQALASIPNIMIWG